ncbi:Fe-S protein [Mycolicibacterium brumae]|uniref:Fe-S protein n=1 Tax=Mycolicibacterium brumae TaxID=85968 RepID=A0A2G5P6K7_9MYCO|nr:Fe-S protein [Mycolicibacterium brumae]MCV7194314.1 Fe-S protein [Mycolicibacterium brumae]PIB73935.1 Fe-S protein [Mycolicibacterium brumae]UWW09667.1 Fe-S protein [Mycolicibacterium brumae]
MEVLRHVVVLLHIVAFAIIFGSWVAEAAARRFRLTAVMNYGLLLALVTGLALAAPWGGAVLNYPKITTKLVLLLALGAVIGIGKKRQDRSGEPAPAPLFWATGAITFVIAGIAVIW